MSPTDQPALPSGTVTFVFTDIEGSTAIARSLGERWVTLVGEHDSRVRAAIEGAGGVVVRTEGDAFFAAFPAPSSAVRAAADAQRAIAEGGWPEDAPIRVRMGIHTGTGVVVGHDYVGYDVHRAARVAAAGHGGQILLSDSTRALVEDELPEGSRLRELGTYRLKDVGAQRLHQLVVDGLPADFPRPRSLEPESNLPAPLTGFVGRNRELERVADLLASTRLLTLTGPGGTGKTRLALEAARRAPDRFEARYFVDLAPVMNADEVIATIAAAVGARDDGGRWVAEVLRDHLSERNFLLVLDNFEQVLDAATDVADLLGSCPRLSVIVTSRAPLRLVGEQELPVPPLGLPDLDDLPLGDDLQEYEAVALFAQRARAVDPGFSLTPEVAPTVAAICARLDGLPLAIELAASRLRSLPPSALLERLERRLPLLTGGARNLPERQRTLRSTIAWSEELLDAPCRTLFGRLSVLLGDWTLDAAEAIANPSSELGIDTLDAIEALRDHSLVRAREHGEGGPWFSMLETIREYALERLASSGEEDLVRRRHAAHFLEVAEAGEGGLTGARAVEWRRRLDREHPNLRAAVEWSLENGDAETGLRISAALWRLWQLRGTLREGVVVMNALLQLPGSRPRTAIRAKALIAAGSIAYWAGDLGIARERYEEALSISRELGDEIGIAHALYNVAFTQSLFDEQGLARTTFEDAQRRFEVLGDPLMTAHAKLARAMVAMRAPDQGDPEPLAAGALQVFEELGAPHSITLAHGILAQIAFVRGDEVRMIRHTRRSVDVSQAVGDPLGTAVQLDVVAAVLGRRGHHERALRLAGASRRIKDDAGGEAPRALIEVEDARTLAAGALSEEQIRGLLEEGAQIGIEDAAELARRELEALAAG